MSNLDTNSDSSYPPFKRPSKLFSQIPDHLLSGATPFEKHVMEELSVMRQMDQWTVETLALTHDYVLQTNGKANRAEVDIQSIKTDVVSLQQDRRAVLGGWKAITVVAMGFAACIGFVLQVYAALRG